MDNGREYINVYQAQWKAPDVLGIPPIFFWVGLLLASMFSVFSLKLWVIGLGVVFCLSVMAIGKRIHKADPYMLPVWFGQLRLRRFYPAHSTPFRKERF
jgi:hypothetical protein